MRHGNEGRYERQAFPDDVGLLVKGEGGAGRWGGGGGREFVHVFVYVRS